MTSFSLAAAAERFGGTILNPDVMFDAISIDSRSINAGDLFFAIQGPNYNGHAFIPDIENKICGAVVNKADCSSDLPQWVVEDTRLALRQIAEMKREKISRQINCGYWKLWKDVGQRDYFFCTESKVFSM